MNVYAIANWFTVCCEAYYMYILFEAFLKRRGGVSKFVYYAAVICMAVLISISNYLFGSGVRNLVLMILIGSVISFIYEGSLKIRLLTSILVIMVGVFTEVLTLFAISIIFNVSVVVIVENGYWRLITIAVSKTLGYALIKWFAHKVSNDVKYINTSYWVLFAATFVLTAVVMGTFCEVLEYGTSRYVYNLIMGCSVGVCITGVIILHLYERTLKQQDILTQQKLSQMQLENQIKHYDELMLSHQRVRKVKHDLENHLNVIKAQINNSDYGQVVKYIDDLMEQTGSTYTRFDTGNTVLDAILSMKMEEAENKGITFKTNLQIPSKLPIDSSDICAIFGNALDNAIEACVKVSDKPEISLELVYGENTLMCRIENSAPEDLDIDKATTKKDIHNHGIGRISINSALEKYNAVSENEMIDGKYVFSFVVMDIDK